MLHALLTDAVTLEFPVRRGAVWKLVKALIDHCDGLRAEVAQSLLDYLFESKPQAPDDPFAYVSLGWHGIPFFFLILGC